MLLAPFSYSTEEWANQTLALQRAFLKKMMGDFKKKKQYVKYTENHIVAGVFRKSLFFSFSIGGWWRINTRILITSTSTVYP